MRKLVLGMTVTTDGFVCGPNGELDWFMRTRDHSVKDWIEKSLWEGSVHIMGRRTFEVMAPYWPIATDQLAEPMNRLPKVVFSKSGFTPKTSYGDTTGIHFSLCFNLGRGNCCNRPCCRYYQTKTGGRRPYFSAWRRKLCTGTCKAWIG